jgi:hypothetical protein
VADEMRIGRISWDEVDDRRVVGRTELGYLAVVTMRATRRRERLNNVN